MVIIRFANDAERKRVEYLLDKWRDKLHPEKLSGIAVLLSGNEGEVSEFLRELFSRVPRDNVLVYKVEPLTVEAPYVVDEFEIETGLGIEGVRSIIDFVMAKFRGGLITDTKQLKRYSVYTRKGLCRVSIHINPADGGSRLRIELEGVKDAVEFLKSRLLSELEALKRVGK